MASSSANQPGSPIRAASPGFDPATALTVGRIIAPHGLRGEVKVASLTDFHERFEPGSRLWLNGAEVRVEQGRGQGRVLILKLDAVNGRTEAEALRGAELQAVPRAESLEEGTYFRDDLIGLKVVDLEGETLGRLAEILATGSNDVYVVRGPRGELLLPATDDVIKDVDLEKKVVAVEVIEGLEWQGAKKASRKQEAGSRRKGAE